MDKELKDKIEKIQEIVQLDFEHDNELFIDQFTCIYSYICFIFFYFFAKYFYLRIN